jgi:hypothetical protein
MSDIPRNSGGKPKYRIKKIAGKCYLEHRLVMQEHLGRKLDREANQNQKIISMIADCKRKHINDPVMIARYIISRNKDLKYMQTKNMVIELLSN